MRYLSANQFDVFEEIGKGGFGVVYRGIDKVTKEEVAIKQIDLEATDHIEDLQREIKILSLCRLEQITRYEGCFVKGHKLWIIMEYLDGGSCLDLLAPGPIKEKHIAILLREMLYALSYLHENGRIHRDVKASNILLNKNGEVKIADFGVSTQLSNNLSRRHTFVGSPYWMCPEVILEEEYNFKADIWSLGITAIELATGKPPLSHIPPMKVLFQIPENTPPRLEGSEYSDDFKEFVELCLQMNPNARPSAKRLLRTRFIAWAGKKSSLSELIDRRQEWEDNHPREMAKKKRQYVPTIMDELSSDKENNITFDFDDNGTSSQNVFSEVIITKKSPLKYGPRDLESPILQDRTHHGSVNNMSDSPRMLSTLKASAPGKSTNKFTTIHPTKDGITESFQMAIKTCDYQDDVQLVKLEHINLLLQELDESLLLSFNESFTNNLKKRLEERSQPSPPQSYREIGLMNPLGPRPRARANTTAANHKSQPQHQHQHQQKQEVRMGPRKAESEKLLLKRWADQYFV